MRCTSLPRSISCPCSDLFHKSDDDAAEYQRDHECHPVQRVLHGPRLKGSRTNRHRLACPGHPYHVDDGADYEQQQAKRNSFHDPHKLFSVPNLNLFTTSSSEASSSRGLPLSTVNTYYPAR